MAGVLIDVAKALVVKLQRCKELWTELGKSVDEIKAELTGVEELCADRQKVANIAQSGIQRSLQAELVLLQELVDEIIENTETGCCKKAVVFFGSAAGMGAEAWLEKINERKRSLKKIMELASEQVNVQQLMALDDIAGGPAQRIIAHAGAKRFWRRQFGNERTVPLATFHDSVHIFQWEVHRSFQELRENLQRCFLGQLDATHDGTVDASELGLWVEHSGVGVAGDINMFELLVRSACSGSLSGAMSIGHTSKITALTMHGKFVASADEKGFVKVWLCDNGLFNPQMFATAGSSVDPIWALKFYQRSGEPLHLFAASKNLVEMEAFTGEILGVIREPHTSRVAAIEAEGEYIFTVGKYPSKAVHGWQRPPNYASKSKYEFFKFGIYGGTGEGVQEAKVMKDDKHLILLLRGGIAGAQIQIWDYKKISHVMTLSPTIRGATAHRLKVMRNPTNPSKVELHCAYRRTKDYRIYHDPLNDESKCSDYELLFNNADGDRANVNPPMQSTYADGDDQIKSIIYDPLNPPSGDDIEKNMLCYKNSRTLKLDGIKSGAVSCLSVARVRVEAVTGETRGGLILLDHTSKERPYVPTVMISLGAWAMHALPVQYAANMPPYCLSKHHLIPISTLINGKMEDVGILSSSKSTTVHFLSNMNILTFAYNIAFTQRVDKISVQTVDAKTRANMGEPRPVNQPVFRMFGDLISAMCLSGSTIYIGWNTGAITMYRFPHTANERREIYKTTPPEGLQYAELIESTDCDEDAALSFQREAESFALAIIRAMAYGDPKDGKCALTSLFEHYQGLRRYIRSEAFDSWLQFFAVNAGRNLSERIIEEMKEMLLLEFRFYWMEDDTKDQTEPLDSDDEKEKEKKKKAEQEKEDLKKKQVKVKFIKKDEKSEQRELMKTLIHRLNAKTEGHGVVEETNPDPRPIGVRYIKSVVFPHLGASGLQLIQYTDANIWSCPTRSLHVTSGQHRCPICRQTNKLTTLHRDELIWQICRKCADQRSEPDKCIKCMKILPVSTPQTHGSQIKSINAPQCNLCYDQAKKDFQMMILTLVECNGMLLAGAVPQKHQIWREGRGELIQLDASTLSVSSRLQLIYPQGFNNIAKISMEHQGCTGGIFAAATFPSSISIFDADILQSLSQSQVACIEFDKKDFAHNCTALHLARSVHNDTETLLFADCSKGSVGIYDLRMDPRTRKVTSTHLGMIDVVGQILITCFGYGDLGRSKSVLAVATNVGLLCLYENPEKSERTHVLNVQPHSLDVISTCVVTKTEILTAACDGTYGRVPLTVLVGSKIGGAGAGGGKDKSKDKGKEESKVTLLCVPDGIEEAKPVDCYYPLGWQFENRKKQEFIIQQRAMYLAHAMLASALGILAWDQPSLEDVSAAKAVDVYCYGRRGTLGVDPEQNCLRLKFEHTSEGQHIESIRVLRCSRHEPKVSKRIPQKITLTSDSGSHYLDFDLPGDRTLLKRHRRILKLTPFWVRGKCRLKVTTKTGVEFVSPKLLKGLVPVWFHIPSNTEGDATYTISIVADENGVETKEKEGGEGGKSSEPAEVTFAALTDVKEKQFDQELEPQLFVSPPFVKEGWELPILRMESTELFDPAGSPNVVGHLDRSGISPMPPITPIASPAEQMETPGAPVIAETPTATTTTQENTTTTTPTPV